ncbi:MAG TPA: hypothetical protein VL633_04950 [Bacteroidota bacterium]|nr:hypothetical protein [Bacteroidota bacterium]
MTRNLLVVVLCLVLASCAATLPYPANYPMTETTVRSRDGILTGKIPGGWYSATEDSLGTGASLILINDNTDAVLSIKELIPDRLTSQRVERDGLALLANVGMSSRRETGGAATTEPREFELRGIQYCSYELSGADIRARVVLFRARGKYYECEARGGRRGLSGETYNNLFTAQQTFLGSLTF